MWRLVEMRCKCEHMVELSGETLVISTLKYILLWTDNRSFELIDRSIHGRCCDSFSPLPLSSHTLIHHLSSTQHTYLSYYTSITSEYPHIHSWWIVVCLSHLSLIQPLISLLCSHVCIDASHHLPTHIEYNTTARGSNTNYTNQLSIHLQTPSAWFTLSSLSPSLIEDLTSSASLSARITLSCHDRSGKRGDIQDV